MSAYVLQERLVEVLGPGYKVTYRKELVWVSDARLQKEKNEQKKLDGTRQGC